MCQPGYDYRDLYQITNVAEREKQMKEKSKINNDTADISYMSEEEIKEKYQKRK